MNTLNGVISWLEAMSNEEFILRILMFWMTVNVVGSIVIAARKRHLIVGGKLSVRQLLRAVLWGIVVTAAVTAAIAILAAMGDPECPMLAEYDCTRGPWLLEFAGLMGLFTGLVLLILAATPVMLVVTGLLWVAWKIVLAPMARGIRWVYRGLRPRVPIQW